MFAVSIIVWNISNGNGKERAVTNLANSLCESGDYKVHIISCCSDNTSMPYFKLNDAISVHHLAVSLRNKIKYFTLQKEIQKVCETTKTDFLLGTTHALNCIMVGIKMSGLKKIACEHMNYGAAPWYSKIFRYIAYPKLDAVVLLTAADKKHYSFCKNTYVIPNSVTQQNESSTCENKVLLAVGRYTRQKGFDMLIKAFALIHTQIPDWKLRIIGQGEDESLLRKLIDDSNLVESVLLISPTKEIAKEYINAGIFLLPSRWEGFVLVLTEAKSFGLPSVAFNCPEGPADIVVHNKDGFLVEPENINKLAGRILQLANDIDLRKQFGKNAVNDIKRLSPVNIFKMWDELFYNLKKE